MARGINKHIIVGNVGQDPEVKSTPSGKSVTTFSVATNHSYIDKTSGEKKDFTEWHDVECWNKLGEIAGEYIKSGVKIYVEGQQRKKFWDKDGIKYQRNIIACQEFEILTPKDPNAVTSASSDDLGSPDDQLPE